MPFETVTISKGNQHQSVGKGLGQAMREVKQMVPGAAVVTPNEPETNTTSVTMAKKVFLKDGVFIRM